MLIRQDARRTISTRRTADTDRNEQQGTDGAARTERTAGTGPGADSRARTGRTAGHGPKRTAGTGPGRCDQAVLATNDAARAGSGGPTGPGCLLRLRGRGLARVPAGPGPSQCGTDTHRTVAMPHCDGYQSRPGPGPQWQLRLLASDVVAGVTGIRGAARASSHRGAARASGHRDVTSRPYLAGCAPVTPEVTAPGHCDS